MRGKRDSPFTSPEPVTEDTRDKHSDDPTPSNTIFGTA
jgi:hypothetical protein